LASGGTVTRAEPSARSRAATRDPYARTFASLSGFSIPPDRSMLANRPFERTYESVSAVNSA
jgi:hypothetical protein